MEIIWYRCSTCDLTFDQSGYTYVQNDHGERMYCSHPGEYSCICKVLAKSDASFGERVGHNSCCICLDCLNVADEDHTRITNANSVSFKTSCTVHINHSVYIKFTPLRF